MGTNLLLACGIVTAMLAALGAVIKAGQWLWTVLRKLARLADDLIGEPPRPGLPEGRLGVLDRLDSMDARWERFEAQMALFAGVEARLAAVEAQLKPNGGGSLRDAVDQLRPTQEPTSV